MSSIPVTLPCVISLGDVAFEVEVEVVYNQIGSTVAIERVTFNGHTVEFFTQQQYEELAEAIRDDLLYDNEGNDD